jgi:outer membrane usher protein
MPRRKKTSPRFQSKPSRRLFLLAFASLVHDAAAGAPADAIEFDASLLAPGSHIADLSRFNLANNLPAGTYRVDLFVNGEAHGKTDLEMRAGSGGGPARACLTPQWLAAAGVQLADREDAHEGGPCVALEDRIPHATFQFDSNDLRVDLSVPQASLISTPRGYVDPALWQSGVTAAIVNYDLRLAHADGGGRGTDGRLGLSGAANLGDWQLRYRSSFNRNKRISTYQSQQLYVRRGLPAITGQLTLGQSETDGQLFDSVGLTGLTLASDERMLPASLRGFAPIVRGVAKSNATVTVKQNGYMLVERTVAPGPFEIDDLYPTGYGSDLEVSVTDTNGAQTRFSLPFASTAQMLRPGAQRYNLALGRYRSGANRGNTPWLAQLTYQRGLSNWFTGYGGANGSQGYVSGLAGGAFNTPLGSVSLDAAHAGTRVDTHADSQTRTARGNSLRLTYTKSFTDTGTTFSLAGLRYSGKDFYSLSEAIQAGDGRYRYRDDDADADADADSRPSWRYDPRQDGRRRRQLQLNLNQAVGGAGAVYANATLRSYWQHSRNDLRYQVGYNGTTRHFNYNLSASRTHDRSGRNNDQLYASISIPIGDKVQMGVSGNSGSGAGSVNTSLYGTAGEHDQFNWNGSLSRDSRGAQSLGLSGEYLGSKGRVNAAAERGARHDQASLGLTGAVALHEGGVTLGQSVGDTAALVHAPGAAGAGLSSHTGIELDGDGYALVPYLNPYRRNQIELDPKGLDLDVELKYTTQEVIPSAGSLVRAEFDTETGRAFVLQLDMGGASIPFGADIQDETGASIGVVGQMNQGLTRKLNENGTINVVWGQRSGQRCTAAYTLPPPAPRGGGAFYKRLPLACERETRGPITAAGYLSISRILPFSIPASEPLHDPRNSQDGRPPPAAHRATR